MSEGKHTALSEEHSVKEALAKAKAARIGEQHIATDKLLPCPFCGGKRLKFSNLCYADDFSIGCDDCRFGQHAYHTPESARDAWNKRAENNASNLREQNASLVKALEEAKAEKKAAQEALAQIYVHADAAPKLGGPDHMARTLSIIADISINATAHPEDRAALQHKEAGK